MLFVLFVAVALILIILVYMAHQLWQSYTRFTPDDKDFEDQIAKLNDYQSHRLSDKHLVNPLSSEDAWALMVRRGLQRHSRRTARRNSRRFRS